MPPKKGQGSRSTSSKKSATIPEGSEHIVFGDHDKKSKHKSTAKDDDKTDSNGPPKPTAKQIIGGASWTGKLPVNLLSEHCQRMKWNKPDYSMHQLPPKNGSAARFRAEVSLSKTDPKTREMMKIPKFRTPEPLVEALEEPSALEARHAAAAYALFRISSMKNLSMALPPKYRDLWRNQFQQVKKDDEKAGKGWLYDADPFAAEEKRAEIHAAMDKRKQDQERKAIALEKNPSLALLQGKGAKSWEKAPKLEMGMKTRTDIEQLVREESTWNPHGISPTKQMSDKILTELTQRGFRATHVQEALRYCKDADEVLEWLLIHVPEDDLPRFALPTNYSAGVSLVSGDLTKDAKLRRLASAGYPSDSCLQALNESSDDEHKAAFWLQQTLISPGFVPTDTDPLAWDDEKVALRAILDDRLEIHQARECSVRLETSIARSCVLRFIVPEAYPAQLPALLLTADKVPAYIRLSAVKQALVYAQDSLLGFAMVHSIYEWLETNLADIVQNPISLTELYSITKNTINSSLRASEPEARKLTGSKRQHVDARTNESILEAWQAKQPTPAQRTMMTMRRTLPAWGKQSALLEAISSHRVTIVSGETGSGKSTQVVQYVLDQAIQELRSSTTNIVCTQPRRVAALSLADRVSSERWSEVGEDVGYIIRGESKVSAGTKVTFMTTGVLLRRLQTSANTKTALKGISHIFVDEVHERSLDTDFLLSLLKSSMSAKLDLKIVLMSATLDAEVFSNYFGGKGRVAHVHIEGRTFPVTDVYVDEVLRLTNFSKLAIGDTDDDEDHNSSLGKAVRALGIGIDYDLIKTLVDYINYELGDTTGAILIFLPGTLEIDRCLRAVSSIPNVVAYPLHASLLPSEQRSVFPPAPKGRRKVIAATNVAETSITIEDVVAVIDTGRVKETRYDIENNIVRLEETWASQAACKQRRGRAGRVRAGTCYKLFTRNTEAKMMPKPLPEIQRVPLEQLCLSVKATGDERDISKFLAETITPPDGSAVANAIDILHQMGALEDDRLTALGQYLATIPADLRCAKLLVYGSLFGCLEPCLTMASILVVKDPFVSPRERREEADAAKATFPATHGDLLLSTAAYDEYIKVSSTSNYRSAQIWCNGKYLSHQTLRDITSTRSQLLDSLKDSGLVPLKYRSPRSITDEDSDKTSPLLLRALISAAMQPQIATIAYPDKKYIQSMTGAKELDPEARTIKYFLPKASESAAAVDNRRVFIHPSSPLFTHPPQEGSLGTPHYLSYFNKMATGPTGNQKTYIRNTTPLNPYSLLLFGGKIHIDPSGYGLVVGGSSSTSQTDNTDNEQNEGIGGFQMRGWARIGVLASRLRNLLDQELRLAFENGGTDTRDGRLAFKDSRVVALVKKLVELNGLDR